jgi:MOSC domain-containing protein YiiM
MDPARVTEFEIVSLLVSPLRRFDGRPAEGPKRYIGPPELVDSVRVRAHKGIVGDRYFGSKHVYATMSLIAEESIQALESALDAGPFDATLSRRNLVTRGLNVDHLARTTFTIEAGHGPIPFRSLTPANPCAWMNEVFAPGAHQALRGHGGIRCEPLADGRLSVGTATMTGVTPIAPDELRRQTNAATARLQSLHRS